MDYVNKLKIKNICCIGAGYVGGPTMAVIALKCPSIQVNVVDLDLEKIKNWNNENLEKLPVFEPGLSEIIKKCRGINLHFSNEIEKKYKMLIWFLYPLTRPLKKKGLALAKQVTLNG